MFDVIIDGAGMSSYVWASLQGFVCGAAVWWMLFKLVFVVKSFKPTIEEAFRND